MADTCDLPRRDLYWRGRYASAQSGDMEINSEDEEEDPYAMDAEDDEFRGSLGAIAMKFDDIDDEQYARRVRPKPGEQASCGCGCVVS